LFKLLKSGWAAAVKEDARNLRLEVLSDLNNLGINRYGKYCSLLLIDMPIGLEPRSLPSSSRHPSPIIVTLSTTQHARGMPAIHQRHAEQSQSSVLDD